MDNKKHIHRVDRGGVWAHGEKYPREENLPEKAVLLLDNAPGHPPGLEEDLEAEFNFIKIKFLPANTTSILQPMDQQVISNFKKLYVKHMFQRCFDATSFTSLTLREFWKDIILSFMLFKSLPDCCQIRSAFSSVDKIVSLGKHYIWR